MLRYKCIKCNLNDVDIFGQICHRCFNQKVSAANLKEFTPMPGFLPVRKLPTVEHKSESGLVFPDGYDDYNRAEGFELVANADSKFERVKEYTKGENVYARSGCIMHHIDKELLLLDEDEVIGRMTECADEEE